ncbi:MAG: hypothetical protein DWQ45_13635 [Planctomycetota bacterium]|nr:MAG: hypothetical protein DWQ41_26400 [Planctomycetota bacterium]REK34317.1 MAG: hypothetical protein DWQ45_13635 [Planctomycetota bacterium]
MKVAKVFNHDFSLRVGFLIDRNRRKALPSPAGNPDEASTLSLTDISGSPFERLSERFEWNTDDHRWDRFSLIGVLRVDALRAGIDGISALPPLEGYPGKSVLIRQVRGNLCPVRESPGPGFSGPGPSRIVCH